MRTAILFGLCFLSSLASAAPLLVDGTAATVGKTLITVQDAYFFRAVERMKEGEKDLLKRDVGEELRRTVQKMVFEEMVLAEMKSFKFEGASRGDAEKALRQLRANVSQASWNGLLTRFSKTEAAVVDCIFRSIQVERFIQKKVETLTPIVTQAEVERYYNQNKGRFQESDYEALKPKIILLLKKERMQKGLEEWVRFLRDKYGVQNYLNS